MLTIQIRKEIKDDDKIVLVDGETEKEFAIEVRDLKSILIPKKKGKMK